MQYTIRQYKDSDYSMIKEWWTSQNEVAPTEDMIPKSSFVLEVDSEPVVSLSLFLTNVPGMCFFENFVGNPLKKGEIRKECGKAIMCHVADVAKKMGYKRIVCYSHKEKVKKRYEDMGMIRTVNNLSSFVKEL